MYYVNYALLNTVDNIDWHNTPVVSMATHVATSLQQEISCCIGVRIFIRFHENNQTTIISLIAYCQLHRRESRLASRFFLSVVNSPLPIITLHSVTSTLLSLSHQFKYNYVCLFKYKRLSAVGNFPFFKNLSRLSINCRR